MTDLKIPNLNKYPNKLFSKKKLSLRRKSKSKLTIESIVMIVTSLLILYLNYLIPNKTMIFNNLLGNFGKLLTNVYDSLFYIYQIILVLFIVSSLILALILFLGSIVRIIKILRRKTKNVQFR